MAPDILRLGTPLGDTIQHSWNAAFLYYFPVSFLILYLFHTLLKHPLISLAPATIQPWLLEQAGGFRFLPVSQTLCIAVSVFVGIVTHFVWDSFTHENGAALRALGLNDKKIQFAPHYSMGMSHLFQDLSSGLGVVVLVMLLFWVYRKHRAPVLQPSIPIVGPAKAVILSAAAVAAILPGVIMLARDPRYWLMNERRQLAGFMTVYSIDVAILEMVGYSILWNRRFGGKKQDRFLEAKTRR